MARVRPAAVTGAGRSPDIDPLVCESIIQRRDGRVVDGGEPFDVVTGDLRLPFLEGYSTVNTTSVKSSQLASPASCIARVVGLRSHVQWLRAANNSSSTATGVAAITHAAKSADGCVSIPYAPAECCGNTSALTVQSIHLASAMAAALAGSSSASAMVPLPHHDEMYKLHVVRSTMLAASGQNDVREICGGANTNHGRTTPSTSASTSTTPAFTAHCCARGTGSIACDWSMPNCRSCALARDPISNGSNAKYSNPTPRIGNSLARSGLRRPATVRPVQMGAYTATMAKVICCSRSSFFASIQSGGRIGLGSVGVNHRGRRSSSRPPSVSCRRMNDRADRTAPAAAKIHMA